jgi:hypothetical protein
MPLIEFECPKCCAKVERIVFGQIEKPEPMCECGNQMQVIEWSIPARRNPEKGIQG